MNRYHLPPFQISGVLPVVAFILGSSDVPFYDVKIPQPDVESSERYIKQVTIKSLLTILYARTTN
jgi:hypothetical protein